MATLGPNDIKQVYMDIGTNERIGIHRITPKTSTGDTFTVPDLANSTSGASCVQLRRVSQSALSGLTYSGNTVTITGTAGEEYIVVTLHQRGRSNYIDEGGSSEPAQL